MLRCPFALVFLATAFLGYAQLPFRVTPETQVLTLFPSVGARIAGGANLHRAGFKQLPGFPNCCPFYQSGEGIGLGLAGFFQLPLNPYLTFQIAGGIAWNSGTLSQIDDNASILQPDGSIQRAVTEFRLNNRISYAYLEPSAQAFPFDFPLSIRAGFRLGYTLSGTFDEKEILVSPPNATFENYSTVRNEQSGEIPDLSAWLYGITLGVGYTLPLSTTLRITPELQYTHQLNTVLKDSIWRMHSLHLALTVAIPLVPHFPPPSPPIRTPDILPAPVIIPSLPKPPPPAIHLVTTVYGVFSDGTVEPHPSIVLEEQELKESFPLLPSVFFEQNGTSLDRTHQVALQPEQVQYFSPTSLPADALAIYRHLLNIVGYRMQQHPQATLTLTAITVPPSRERSIPKGTAKARAAAIKEYLTTVWRIDPRRIRIKTRTASPPPPNYQWTQDLWEELERVDISADIDAITLPVQIRHVSRTITPSALLILPAVTAEAGVRRFAVEATINSYDTILYEGNSPPDTLQWTLNPHQFARFQSDSLHILATLVDSARQQRATETALPFTSLTVNLKRQIGSKDTLIEKFSLILFAFDKADLGPRNLKILQDVISQIKPNSQVTILGYTDRIGLKDYNKKLAEARCKEVMKALQRSGVAPSQLSYTAIGSDMLLYDNDLPEGRSYSRTVQIIIRTPLTPE